MEDFGCSGIVLKSPFLSLEWDLIHFGQTSRAIDKYRKYRSLLNEKELKRNFYPNRAATPFGGISTYQRNRQDSVVVKATTVWREAGKRNGVSGYSNLALSRNLIGFFNLNMGFTPLIARPPGVKNLD